MRSKKWVDKMAYATIAAAIIVIAWILFSLGAGCAATGYRRDSQTSVSAPVATHASGGRDVNQNTNDPWSVRILAAGLAAIPASFVLYLIAHRFPTLRRMFDGLKGVHCRDKLDGKCVDYHAIADAIDRLRSSGGNP